MFYIKGRRVAKIKSYDDKYAECSNCRTATIRFTIFREYFHVFFLPLFPSNIKDVKGECLKCGKPNANHIKENYLDQTKTPLYFYSGAIIFFTGMFLLTIFWINQSKEESLMIENPKVGDVYLIENGIGKNENYYWAKVNEIKDGHIYLIRSTFEYKRFYSEMGNQDYFDLNKRSRIKEDELQKMYNDGKIKSVKRDYPSNSRFNLQKNYPNR